jgi:hypothetical protein
MAFYTGAIAYGEYGLADVLLDMRRREMIKSGRSDLANTTIIDPTTKASEFKKTSKGMSVATNPDFVLPAQINGVDSSIFKLPIFKMPDEVFKTIVKPFDPNSAEGKAEIDKVQSAYHDVLLQQLNAKTERDKALADSAYQEFKTALEKNYGIKLSNDSLTAWNQIEGLGQDYSARGLTGSGFEAENIDNYLRSVRRQDSQYRDEKLTKEMEAKKEFYTKSATPEQIKNDLTEEEKLKWGLKPSADQLQFFTTANIKSKFPNLTDEEIEDYKNSIIDQYGNYRSELYQTLYTNQYKTKQEKKTYQEAQVQSKAALAEEKAYQNLEANAAVADQKATEQQAKNEEPRDLPQKANVGSSKIDQVVKLENNPTVYVISGDKKYPVQGVEEFNALNLQWPQIRTLKQEDEFWFNSALTLGGYINPNTISHYQTLFGSTAPAPVYTAKTTPVQNQASVSPVVKPTPVKVTPTPSVTSTNVKSGSAMIPTVSGSTNSNSLLGNFNIDPTTGLLIGGNAGLAGGTTQEKATKKYFNQ